MSGVLDSTTYPRQRIPATALFTSRELRQYRRWQGLHTSLKPNEQGYLPTALEYDEFRDWLSKQDSGYFSNIFEDIASHIAPTQCKVTSSLNVPLAAICRHVMHPAAAPYYRLRCPVCTIEVHLNYIKALARSLQRATGRPLPGTGSPSEQQEILYRAWSVGKIEALRQLSELERVAAEELEWSGQHEEIRCDDLKTAREALELYWFETSGCTPVDKHNKEKTRSVAFAVDTDFEPGRHPDYFLKISPRYEPGKYTVEEEELDVDCGISEDSEDYSPATCFIVGGPDDVIGPGSLKSYNTATQHEDALEEFDWDDGDGDWVDVDSDDEDESSDSSYICFDIEEETNFIVFSND